MASIEFRDVPETETTQVNDLVSRAFQYQPPHCFLEDFPIWGSNQVRRLGAFESGRLVSHVGIRFCEMMIPRERTPVALIGAVATDESFRGRGLSTELLKQAIRIIEAKDCKWSILWGSEHEFYGRLGFKLEGDQGRALISDLAISTENLQASKLKCGLTERIFQEFLRRKSGLRFEESDRSWFFEHKTVEWFYLDDPFAFVAYQRGMDLRHIVHEAGGSIDGIHRILYQIYQGCGTAQVMGSDSELKALGFPEDAIFKESLCLARPTYAGEVWNKEFWISGLSAC